MSDTSIHLSRRPARHPSAGWPDRAAYRGVDPGRSARSVRKSGPLSPRSTDVWPPPRRPESQVDDAARPARRVCGAGRLLDGVRAGRSAALVLRGEAGVGKSALLDYAVASAADLRVVRARGWSRRWGWRSPGCISCAGRCLTGWGGCLARSVPRWKRRSACEAGPAPDRFLVGLAVLSLLSEAAGERPLVCVMDDAQWLDQASAQALAFAARRLASASRCWCCSPRGSPPRTLAGCPNCWSVGLRAADARELLDSALRWPMDDRVRDQIVAETRGNPLALVDLPRGLSPRPSWPAASGCRRRCRCPAGSSRSSAGRSGGATRADPAAAGGRGGRADRRPGAVAAGRRTAGHLGSGRRDAGGARRAVRVRCPGAVPASAGPLGGLPVRLACGPAAGTPRPGGGHRSAGRPGPPRLAPGPGRAGARRGCGRRARAVGQAGPRRAAGWPPPPRSSSAPRR